MIHGRTNPRDSSGDAIIVGDLVRPDKVATVLLDGEKIAAPIGEVNGITIHCGSGRNISTSREYPFWIQARDVAGTDCMFGRLAPCVAQILSSYWPLANTGTV